MRSCSAFVCLFVCLSLTSAFSSATCVFNLPVFVEFFAFSLVIPSNGFAFYNLLSSWRFVVARRRHWALILSLVLMLLLLVLILWQWPCERQVGCGMSLSVSWVRLTAGTRARKGRRGRRDVSFLATNSSAGSYALSARHSVCAYVSSGSSGSKVLYKVEKIEDSAFWVTFSFVCLSVCLFVCLFVCLLVFRKWWVCRWAFLWVLLSD